VAGVLVNFIAPSALVRFYQAEVVYSRHQFSVKSPGQRRLSALKVATRLPEIVRH
jgi:hypothetical protein